MDEFGREACGEGGGRDLALAVAEDMVHGEVAPQAHDELRARVLHREALVAEPALERSRRDRAPPDLQVSYPLNALIPSPSPPGKPKSQADPL
jgi:hypothetical protein